MDVLPLGLAGDGALRAAVAADREAARWEAAKMDHLVEYLLTVCDQGVATSPVPGGEETVRLGGPGTPPVPEFVVCEVAAALAMSQPAASSLVADALDLGVRLPATLAAVRNGSLTLVRARTVARGTRDLEQAQATVVEERVTATTLTDDGWVPLAARVTPGRLRSVIEQAVVVARGPEEADERRTRERQGLCVDVVGGRDGVADLYARLGSEDAARLHTRLDQVARWLARLGDDRPHRVLRAVAVGYLADPHMLHALTDLAAQAAPLPAAPIESEALAARLARADDAGMTDAGPDDADAVDARAESADAADTSEDAARRVELMTALARRLEGERRSVLYLHLDATTGTCTEEQLGVLTKAQLSEILGHSRVTVRPVLDLAAELTYTGYVAPPLLRQQRALLNAGQCTFPHCNRRARAGDVDHEVPYPRVRGSAFAEPGPEDRAGSTTSSNTHMPCRKHHRAKTHGGWQVHSPAPGVWLWRSPAGAHYLVTAGTTTALNGVHDVRAHTGSKQTPSSSTRSGGTSRASGTSRTGGRAMRGPIALGDHEEAGAGDLVGAWTGGELGYVDTG